MRSEVLIVAEPGRHPRLECTGGIAVRRTATDVVHLVSAAATPLGGDVIRVRVVVEEGARLRVRSAAATMAMRGAATAESLAAWRLEVAGELDLDPEPTIVAGGARHVTSTALVATTAARVRIRERAQIGRAYEREGFWSSALRADVGEVPLLRHRIEVGTAAVADDVLGAPRACISELRYPERSFEAAGTVLELAAGGSIATWQGERLHG